jgi:hypothetical protein
MALRDECLIEVTKGEREANDAIDWSRSSLNVPTERGHVIKDKRLVTRRCVRRLKGERRTRTS